ncbi:MAG TPA: thermonuclease family protein [Methanolinea sp.]|nr:thermonuclease family protein [Methanolinea sp.]
MSGSSLFRFIPLAIALACLLAIAGCIMPVKVTLDPSGNPAYTCGIPVDARVTRVIDGDTIAVKTAGGREETVRILGIDTPETEEHGNWGNEYEGISSPVYLTSWGYLASDQTENLVKGKGVTLMTDCMTGERDRYGRLLAYVGVDGSDLGSLLLEGGYARVYTEESFGKKQQYLLLQSEAQSAGAGLWSAAKTHESSQKSPVSIVFVQYDAPGDDRENPNGEYIVLASDEPLNLSGWTIADNSGTIYRFGNVFIHPGDRVTLHIGSGTPTGTTLYWNLSAPLLGNDADAVTLRDPDGKLIAVYRWGQ